MVLPPQFQWSVIVVTTHGHRVDLVQSELNLLRTAGAIGCHTSILTVDDPVDNLGSGGSTLNALLVAVEHLCVQAGFSVLTEEVLRDAKIFVYHMGKPCGSEVFRSLPASQVTEKQLEVPLNCFLHAYDLVSELAEMVGQHGLWVCGGDHFLAVDKTALNLSLENQDMIAFTIPVLKEYSVNHGVYILSQEGFVEDILYQESMETLSSAFPNQTKVPLVLALVYMNSSVTEAFLSLHSKSPLNCCTYLGIDSGGLAVKLSLFFDIVLATSNTINEENFVKGNRSDIYVKKQNFVEKTETRNEWKSTVESARSCVWRCFHGFSAKAVSLPSLYYHYFTKDPENTQEFQQNITRILSLDHNFSVVTSKGNCEFSGEEEIRNVLTSNINRNLLPKFGWLCLTGRQEQLLTTLDSIILSAGNYAIAGRVLSCIADVLAILAGNDGGLRSGPAAHPDWLGCLKLLEMNKLREGVELLAKTRQDWINKRTPSALIRAARHYEAAAQVCVRKTVMPVQKWIAVSHSSELCGSSSDSWFCYEAAARIDVAGGWSDTPPITYEFGGSVLNIAIKINGKKPIAAKCRRIGDLKVLAYLMSDSEQTMVEFTRLSDFSCFSNPQASGSLVAAVLIFANIISTQSELSLSQQLMKTIGSGIEISCQSALPQGSGLGTSSILAGALLAAVWKLLNLAFTTDDLLHAVLCVEQLLTSGGGWQDQVGGLSPGVKIGRFNTHLTPPRIEVEHLNLSEDQIQFLNSRLMLVYTGRTRLAKNLLQEVVRNWYARKADVVKTVTSLVATAESCAEAIKNSDWRNVGKCAQNYWSQKCHMAPGCEPTNVRALLDLLYRENLIHAGWLAGAGGGGFLYLLTKEPKCTDQLKKLLTSSPMYKKMAPYDVEIDMEPLIYSCQLD